MGSHQCLNNLLEIKRMIGLLYRDEAYALISIKAPVLYILVYEWLQTQFLFLYRIGAKYRFMV